MITQSPTQIINFLNKYNITYIDQHTSIITTITPQQIYHYNKTYNNNNHNNTYHTNTNTNTNTNINNNTNNYTYTDQLSLQQSSFDFLYKNINNGQKNNNKMPQCYLIKDMIIQDNIIQNYNQGHVNNRNDNDNDIHENGNQQQQENIQQICKQNIMKNVLDTLAIHQQLKSKYILKLVHYQTFLKSVAIQQSQISNITNNNNNTNNNTQHQLNKNQYNMNKQKNNNNNINTQIQQSYQQQSLTIPKSSRLTSKSKHNNNNNNKKYEQQKNYGFYNYSCNQPTQHITHDNINNNTHTNLTTNNQKNTTILNTTPTIQKPAIRAIYQYGKLTLKQQIDNRIASNTQFQQQQLWAILATIVQALGYLQQQGIVYGVLGTDKIFINDSLVKILDPSATATDPLLIAQGRLYSPQILNDQQNIDMFKSDVYITGLVILQCGLLTDLSKQIQPNITKYLQQFNTIYSNQLLQILQMCLTSIPNQRPNFQQLKQLLAKQLDMNDFQSAYNNKGIKILQPMENDIQDNCCQLVKEIQMEFQGCSFDVLYESIGEEGTSVTRKYVTQYQRAKIRYLGIYNNNNNMQNNYSPRRRSYQNRNLTNNNNNNNNQYENEDENQNQYNNNRHHQYLQQTQQHRHTSSSPVATRRNSRNKKQSNSQQHGNLQKLPNFNMAISQSVYTDQIIPITNANMNNMNANNNGNKYDKTNRKSQRPPQPQCNKNIQYYNCNNTNQIPMKDKQNKAYGQQHQQQIYQQRNSQYGNIYTNRNINTNINPSTSEKIKKTKLIKQKLVKNQYHQNSNNMNMNQKDEEQHTFGSLKRNNSQNGNLYYKQNNNCNSNININNNNNRMGNHNQGSRDTMIYNKGLSIQEEVDQEDSSYLYYNNNGSSKVSKKQDNSIRNSQGNLAQNSNSNMNYMKNSNSSKRYQNCQTQPQQQIRTSKNKFTLEQDQLFTDPNLMRTIKDDLARISTTKNVKAMGSGLKQSNKWFK